MFIVTDFVLQKVDLIHYIEMSNGWLGKNTFLKTKARYDKCFRVTNVIFRKWVKSLQNY